MQIIIITIPSWGGLPSGVVAQQAAVIEWQNQAQSIVGALDYIAVDYPEGVLAENISMMFFLDIRTAIAISKTTPTALGTCAAIFPVQSVTVPINSLLHACLFKRGALIWLGFPKVDVSALGLIAYIGVIAAVVQIKEMVFDRYFPVLYTTFGVFLPIITVNCAILGGTLFSVQRSYGFGERVVFGVGSGGGWALAIVALAEIRERVECSDVPEGLQGTDITFIIFGLTAVGFMGFSGLRLESGG
jgi:Na+-transporting NADH:ubiquinone oxidoreductase subunit E